VTGAGLQLTKKRYKVPVSFRIVIRRLVTPQQASAVRAYCDPRAPDRLGFAIAIRDHRRARFAGFT